MQVPTHQFAKAHSTAEMTPDKPIFFFVSLHSWFKFAKQRLGDKVAQRSDQISPDVRKHNTADYIFDFTPNARHSVAVLTFCLCQRL